MDITGLIIAGIFVGAVVWFMVKSRNPRPSCNTSNILTPHNPPRTVNELIEISMLENGEFLDQLLDDAVEADPSVQDPLNDIDK